MKLVLCVSIFIQLLIVNLQTLAQPNIKFHNITTKDGLAGDMVYALHQDKQGFLWIGTHRGLNRYDGYSFRLYVYDPSDTNSISGNHIHCIKEDADGVLWLGTNKGLNSLDPISGKIKRYALPEPGMPEFMKDIFLVNDSILLITTPTGLYRFNKRTNRFTPIKIPQAPYPFYAGDKAKFTRDKKGSIYIVGGPDGEMPVEGSYEAVIINWQNATAEYVTSRNVLHAASSRYRINQLYFDSKNNTWCFEPGAGLISREIGGKKIQYPYTTADVRSVEGIISSFYEEPGERLWIATGGGLVLYDYPDNRFYRYQQQNGNIEALAKNRVSTIIKDRKGVYWVGTAGAGLCRFTTNSNFKNLTIDTSTNAGEHSVYGLKTLHSGRILIRSLSGKKFMLDTTIKSLNNPKDSITVDSTIQEISGRPRHFFSENDYWMFFIACNGKVYPGAKKNYAAVKDMPVGDIIIDKKNKVWCLINGSKLASVDKTIYLDHAISGFFPFNEHKLLLATKKGLQLLNTASGVSGATYLPQTGNPYSIGSSYLNTVLPDESGNYWVGTADAGFDYWDTRNNRFYHYTMANGLPDNTIYTMLPDKHGRLWLGTNKGLSCFDTTAKTFTNYDTNDGLINTEFNTASACVDKEGFMYFGGMDGIDYFHPDSFMHASIPPALYISGFKLQDRLQPVNSAYAFASNDNNINIEFTGNDFLNAKKILFRYKLTDVDKEWIIGQGINRAGYNKLPPGNYHFTVQSSYNGKIWSEPIVVDFSIATPWFQSRWFFTLLILCMAAALYLLFNYRLQQKLKILMIRNRLHRDLHADVGATLSSVKAYSEILSNDPGNAVIDKI